MTLGRFLSFSSLDTVHLKDLPYCVKSAELSISDTNLVGRVPGGGHGTEGLSVNVG